MDTKNFVFSIVLTFNLLCTITSALQVNVTGAPSNLLSRTKRFLTFPDGSSVQLVYETQNHGYLQVGDIVWFSNTAALAWELPTDPQLFHLYKKSSKDFAQRRGDVKKHIYYVDEKGKLLSKVPYRRKPLVNPAFGKRSIDNLNTKEHESIRKTLSIKKMHEMEKSKSYLNNLDDASVDFHREGRKSFYVKLEKFLVALGWRGRDCVLRILCQSGKREKEQGTFLEEILWATFTLPKGKEFQSEEHKQYDVAFNNDDDCFEKYPDCEDMNGQQLF